MALGSFDGGQQVVGAGCAHAVQAEQFLTGQEEQVGEVSDQPALEHLLDTAFRQAFNVELVAADRVDDGGGQTK
ncbi:hypothetical protein [Nonomuraea sp. NPDC050786]|uniref:hypothetical protein n=1 Tax=Nonomuraea sp. NPDC050786 TaxID=3154840 RepID=UPI0033FCC3D7